MQLYSSSIGSNKREYSDPSSSIFVFLSTDEARGKKKKGSKIFQKTKRKRKENTIDLRKLPLPTILLKKKIKTRRDLSD